MNQLLIHTDQISDHQIDQLHGQLPGELEPCSGFYRYHTRSNPSREQLLALAQQLVVDINALPPEFQPGEIRLLISDMDSTLINIECIDEIADFAGLKPQVAAITESAMRGEIDFSTSLRKRVGLLDGLDEAVLGEVFHTRLKLNPGAGELLAFLKSRTIKSALVSGGFTFFAQRIVQDQGMDFVRANMLEIKSGKLTGKVVGEIVDAEVKRRFLQELCEQLGIGSQQAIAMGDGANDLKMMSIAGLSVAYKAKPAVQAQAMVNIRYSSLASVSHFLG